MFTGFFFLYRVKTYVTGEPVVYTANGLYGPDLQNPFRACLSPILPHMVGLSNCCFYSDLGHTVINSNIVNNFKCATMIMTIISGKKGGTYILGWYKACPNLCFLQMTICFTMFLKGSGHYWPMHSAVLADSPCIYVVLIFFSRRFCPAKLVL